MWRRNKILGYLTRQVVQPGTKGHKSVIDPRPIFFVMVDPCCLLVAFHPEVVPSHPHFAYEAETRQLTRSEPGCECYVLHSVNRLMDLMLLRGLRVPCKTWAPSHTAARPFLNQGETALGQRPKSLSYHPIPPPKLCPIISCRFDLVMARPASRWRTHSDSPPWHWCQRLRRRVRDITPLAEELHYL